MINLLFGSLLKKIIFGCLALSLAFLAWQVRGCMKAKERLKAYEQAERIRQQDKKIDQKIEGYKGDVEGYKTDEDFRKGFDKLREYGK